MDALNTLMNAAQEFAAQLLVIALPVLAATAVGYLLTKTQDALQEFRNTASNEQRYLIEESARFIVQAAEQMKRAKVLPSSAEAKGWAVQALNDKLSRMGISLPVGEIANLIEAAVWEELNSHKKG